ncbi:MAG TPA: SRPBCC domain-containing protein [Acidimicrobiales bacterium]|jgi:uncharacterized protein YndB with AHSA1/START domain|nr:SRPBCC domain-containing protein [Acidimicrobiales bacterium]
MLERQVFIPADPQRVWENVTDPEAVSGWFGADVDWDLDPGGRARFVEDDGTVREGRVDEVVPRRYLRFSWWPEGHPDDETSEVSYTLAPEGDGTTLTVTERPLPTGQRAATLSASTRSGTARDPRAATWTALDDHLVAVWSRANAPVSVGAR